MLMQCSWCRRAFDTSCYSQDRHDVRTSLSVSAHRLPGLCKVSLPRKVINHPFVYSTVPLSMRDTVLSFGFG